MSAEKVFDILDLFNERNNQLSVTKMAELMNMPQSSVYRHVRILKERGYLIENEKGLYKLGYRFLEFANIVKLDNSLANIALRHMKDLTNELGETTILSVRSDVYAVCVETVSSPQTIKVSSEQGKILPLYIGGSSKAILAFQEDEVVGNLFNRNLVKKHTENTLTTEEEIFKDLASIRERGYAISDSEIDPGVYTYGFPVRNIKGEVFASLSIAGPKDRIISHKESELVDRFHAAVYEIEKYL